MSKENNLNLDKFKDDVSNFVKEMFDFKDYCIKNGINDSDPKVKEQWKRDYKIKNLLKEKAKEDMAKTNIENERRWLLKNVPGIDYDDTIEITQYYLKVDDVWERYRKATHSNGDIKYYKTIKKFIEIGSSEEDEKKISLDKYLKFKEKCHNKNTKSRLIKKTRYVHIVGGGFKWEIDKFKDMRVVIAEIELPYVSFNVDIPDWLDSEIIMEVTKHKKFSSRSLATRL